ncbi:substrate-binding domain-containing protein [Novosphingobium arvoryzae]|uniref:Ribose ABC transporter substrate-binding protein n=1 Tax=Novosphingobium arvoryzae TaxID=1256514 RepID=A0A918RAF0_9SPHN|nr:substrate-binding domain-containing protein [Novosphingobium arvoryzae]GGZ88284.1 ribose ABC transporter substrate-binding protein [Novosphingobium arvoryzae]
MTISERFVIVPKIAHPWSDEVRLGADRQADLLAAYGKRTIAIDYRPPDKAEANIQEAILAGLLDELPTGVAVDPVATPEALPTLLQLRAAGVPVVLFDCPEAHSGLCSIGNDFVRQGAIAAEKLIEIIGGTGKVAIMQGVPDAPNHHERFEAQCRVLRDHPGITIVDGGTDHDSIALAEQAAIRTLSDHADLRGYLCCDAAGPIGIANALRLSGRWTSVACVAMDGIRPILEAIRDGVIRASSATKPRMQGAMIVQMLWLAGRGVQLPCQIDTGIDVITPVNVAQFLAEC